MSDNDENDRAQQAADMAAARGAMMGAAMANQNRYQMQQAAQGACRGIGAILNDRAIQGELQKSADNPIIQAPILDGPPPDPTPKVRRMLYTGEDIEPDVYDNLNAEIRAAADALSHRPDLAPPVRRSLLRFVERATELLRSTSDQGKK